MTEPIGVGLIGFGYWGPKLARNIDACPSTRLTAIVVRDPKRRAAALASHPRARAFADLDALLEWEDSPEAIVIATPASTHYGLAEAALAAGKHVFVEKPLALSAAECGRLIDRAEHVGRTLMVDHTFLYGGPVEAMRELITAGALGEVLHYDSVRSSLGPFQRDMNVLWELAPHDLSIVDYALGAAVEWVSADLVAHYPPFPADVAYVTLGLGETRRAHLHLSWLAPTKTRRVTIAGTRGALVFDETLEAEKLRLYDRWCEPTDGAVRCHPGDERAPSYDMKEALLGAVEEFAAAISTGRAPRSDGRCGQRVAEILEAAERSAALGGARVEL